MKKIKDTGPKQPRIDPETVAKALGADCRVSKKGSKVMSKPFWLLRALTKVKRLGNLPDDWTSYGCDKPSELAVEQASEALRWAWYFGIKPSRIAPMADGGIDIHFIPYGDKKTRVAIYNDGGMVLVRKGKGAENKYDEYTKESDIKEVMKKAAKFLTKGSVK